MRSGRAARILPRKRGRSLHETSALVHPRRRAAARLGRDGHLRLRPAIPLGADAMGPATDYDRALYASLVWYNAVYAVAVGAGFLAAAVLLARSTLAIPLAAISVVAVIVQVGWLFATTDIVASKGIWVTYFPLVILAVAVFALWLARHARARRWIG
ncbi:hypothetical protein AB5I41_01095 [Sphingomonas sp. MMS24-JH45]